MLRGLIERVSIRQVENGLEIEIIGEIAKMSSSGLEAVRDRSPSMRQRPVR